MLSKFRIFFHHIKENLEAEDARWIVWSPVLFGTGILIYFSFSFELSKWIILLLIELLLVLFFIFRNSHNKVFVLCNFFIIVLGFAMACLQSYYISKSVFPVEKETKSYIKARIDYIDYNYRGKQRLIVDDVFDYYNQPIKGTHRFSLTTENIELKTGDCIETVANFAPLTKPFLVGGYEPQRDLFFNKISSTGYISTAVYKIDCEKKLHINDYMNHIRQKIDARIKSVLPKDVAGVVSSISIGERGGISMKISENYRDSGLAHFLSISGLHMSMITGLMFFFIRFIVVFIPYLSLRFDSKKIAAVFAIVVSFIYLLISGMQIPAQRAFIMTTIVLIGVLFDRIAISMRVIAISAIVILIISPISLLGPSFQMSFSAVIALIAFYERYSGSVSRFIKGEGYNRNSLFKKTIKIFWVYIVGILLTDFVASIVTSVFASYHFNRISIYTTIGNLLSGPIIGFIIMPFLLFSLILMPFGLDYYALRITGYGVSLVNDIVFDVASMDNASILVPSFPVWGLLLMSFGFLWLCIWQRKWRIWGFIAIFIGFLSIFTSKQPDILINDDASVVAIKDNYGDIVVLPSKGNHTLKRIWQEKTASRALNDKEKKELKEIYNQGQTQNWLDLSCQENYCDYKNKVRIYKSGRLYDLTHKKDITVKSGGSIWLEKDGIKIITIDEYIGKRLWNQERK